MGPWKNGGPQMLCLLNLTGKLALDTKWLKIMTFLLLHILQCVLQLRAGIRELDLDLICGSTLTSCGTLGELQLLWISLLSPVKQGKYFLSRFDVKIKSLT